MVRVEGWVVRVEEVVCRQAVEIKEVHVGRVGYGIHGQGMGHGGSLGYTCEVVRSRDSCISRGRDSIQVVT